MVYGSPMMRRTPKVARVSARVTAECRGLIDALMQKTGLGEGPVLEIVLRDYAERHSVEPLYWEKPSE